MMRRGLAVGVMVLALLGSSGCASFGPTSVNRDRFDYIQALATSWKHQTLLNIVKLRYADTPVFLDVTQVIGSYQLQAGFSVGGSVNFGGPPFPNGLSLGTAGTYTDRPTVIYTPLTGAHFLKVIMTPVPPPASPVCLPKPHMIEYPPPAVRFFVLRPILSSVN